MSKFGWYVHRKWANYEKYGTYQKQGSNQRYNFQANIFKKHRNLLVLQAQNQRRKDLDALEERYNQINQEQFNSLAKAASAGTLSKGALTELIKLVSSTWEESADAIAQNLQWDSENMRVKVPQGTFFENKFTDQKISPLSLSKDYKIDNLIKKLSSIKPLVEDNSFYSAEVERIINKLNSEKNRKNESASVLAKVNMQSKRDKNTLYRDDPAAQDIIQSYNNIVSKFLSASTINKRLSWRIPELIGDFATNGMLSVAEDALETTLKDWKSSSQSHSQSISQKGFMINLNKAELSDMFHGANEELAKQITESFIGPDKSKVSYKMRMVGAGRAKKADIEWEITTPEGRNETVGISLKTTNMLDERYPLSLQNSSLLLYLMGVQNMQADLGNHYLNILADHEDDESGKYNIMRQQADDALSLAIVYSALTGNNQMRTGGSAQIFAIWDRKATNGTPRIKFFDVNEILLKLNRNPDQIQLSPDISTIRLQNTFVEDRKTQAGVQKRLTRLIVDARSRVIKATLSKSFIKNMY